MESTLDDIFEALSNHTRRSMVDTLAYRPATISQLAEEQQLSLPAIHKHIRTLEKARLVQRKKVGRVNFVAFDRQAMTTAQNWIMQYNTAWGSNQETLENYISSFKHRAKADSRHVDK